MKSSGGLAYAVAASLAVASCTQPAPKVAPPVRSVFGPGVYAIEPCAANVPKPSPAETYTITIDNKFELRRAVVSISGHAQSSKPPKPHPHRTLLHLNTDLVDGQSATVRIVLDDPLLKFQDIGVALRGGDQDAPKIFCGVVQTDRVLSFTVYRYAGGPTYASYNLGLTATDKKNGNYDLPVFIDPGIDNDG